MSIVVVGSLNMDHIMQVDGLPRRGETVFSQRYTTAPGGKGANQAGAAARLGAEVAMVGCVGDDPSGHALVRSLSAIGVDTSAVSTLEQEPTGSAFITVSESAANTIVVHRGANFALSPQLCYDWESLISRANVLVVQLEIPMESVMAALRIARRHRVTTVLNPAPAAPLRREALELADYLVPNETEAAFICRLVGYRGLPEDSPAVEAATALARATRGTVIVTLGENGCACATYLGRGARAPGGRGAGEREATGTRARGADDVDAFAAPAFKVRAVDSTAAGDAFVGALAYRLDKSRATGALDLEGSVRFASAAGALAATKVGAQPSLPTLSDINRLLEASERGAEV